MKKFLVTLFAIAYASAAWAVDSETFVLNAFVQGQAVKQLESVLPKGQFLVQTEVKLKAEDQTVQLPLGGSIVRLSDLQDIKSLPLKEVLQRIRSIKLQVSVEKEVSEAVKKSIDQLLVSNLYLDPKRGDKIEFVTLPEGWQSLWHPVVAKEKAEHTIEITLAAVFAAFIAMLFFCFQRLQTSLTRAVREVGAARDAEMPTNFSELNRSKDSSSSQVLAGDQSSSHNGFENVDVKLLIAFAVDTHFVEKYRGITAELLNGILAYNQSSSLESLLPENFLRKGSGPARGESFIAQLFFRSMSDYRQMTKSLLLERLTKLDLPQLSDIFKQVNAFEQLTLLKNIGPLSRGALIELLSPQERIRLAKSGDSVAQVEQVNTALSRLIALMDSKMPSTDTDGKKPFTNLSGSLLQAFTHAEDEAFYQESLATEGLNYESILSALTVFTAEDWARVDLRELAIAFHGYSDAVIMKLESVFDGKRREWLKSLFERMNQESTRSFLDHDAVNARNLVIQTLNEKMSTTDRREVA